jgi:hypothetical protein
MSRNERTAQFVRMTEAGGQAKSSFRPGCEFEAINPIESIGLSRISSDSVAGMGCGQPYRPFRFRV